MPMHPYTYDAENRLISAGGMTYLYDGDGKRVAKAPSSSPTQPNYLYWYGTGSNILEETDASGHYLYLDFYFNGRLLSRMESDNWVDHLWVDALGNVRTVYGDSDPDGGSSDYYPFGGERPVPSCCPMGPGGINIPFKFTGKEHDAESGLDNFLARHFTSTFGRFLSPDPESAGASPDDPQSWNAYSYVENNPLNMTDPDGLGGCDNSNAPGGCVEVSAHSPDDEITFSYSYRHIMLRQLSNAAQRANDDLRAAWNWYNTSTTNWGCVQAAVASGAAAGAGMGAGAGPTVQAAFALATGGASEAFGGPPGGAAIGAVAGGVVGATGGFIAGVALCRQGTGSGGGASGSGGRATGSSARLTRPQQRQTAKYLGMREVKGVYSDGELVFEKNGRYFSFSNTSHTAGEVFKEVDRNGNRIATTDLNFNRIGR